MKGMVTSKAIAVSCFFAFFGVKAASSEVAKVQVGAQRLADPGELQNSSLVSSDTDISGSCFTPYDQVSHQYTLVNVSKGPLPAVFPKNSIHLSSKSLKAKRFLREQPILIAAESYKRFELTQLCRDLLKSGFKSPQIALWFPSGDGDNSEFLVSAKEYLVEAKNFGVVTVAENMAIANELSYHGVSAVYPEDGQDIPTFIQSVVSDYAQSDYLPIFLLTLNGEKYFKIDSALPVYQVQGGIAGIKSALDTGRLSALKLNGKEFGSSCAK